MKLLSRELNGLVLIEPHRHQDRRGYFFESFNETDFRAVNLPTHFPQDNVSLSLKGTVRGLHFQSPPHSQGKLVRVMGGSVFDVAVDLRKGSATYGRWHGEELSAENALALFIPPGFAHGFCVTSETALLFYKCTAPYHPAAERTLRWDDPQLNIKWPPQANAALVSEKDAKGLSFSGFQTPF